MSNLEPVWDEMPDLPLIDDAEPEAADADCDEGEDADV